jgi:hypothetical protein
MHFAAPKAGGGQGSVQSGLRKQVALFQSSEFQVPSSEFSPPQAPCEMESVFCRGAAAARS